MGFFKKVKNGGKKIVKGISSSWDKWGKDLAIGLATGGVGLAARAGYKMYNGLKQSQKESAAAELAAAQQYADAQDRVAAAIESSSQVAPKAVQAGSMGVQESVEGNAQAAQKRKRTIASTVAPGWGSSILGGASRL